MKQIFCQSCAMPLDPTNLGTNSDGSVNEDYCAHCYRNGKFTMDVDMDGMIDFCAQFTDQMNQATGWNLTPEQAKAQMRQIFPTLKRWKQNDGKTLPEKAAELLQHCEVVTLATVNAEGFPRPVPLAKLHSVGCNEVWIATSAASVKVTDLKHDSKAGLSYWHNGDSVSLRGTAEVITDDATRRQMWQDFLKYHFPGGPADPDYVLLRFIGSEATLWINMEFAHIAL